MDIARLTRLVESEMRSRAALLGLERDAIEARFVVNWGGFTNQSFSVGDAHRRYHLKVTQQPADQAKLRRWHDARAELAAKYHAPEVVDWIALPGTSHQGLLLQHVDGREDGRWTRELRRALGDVLGRLHADDALKQRLFPGTLPGSCADGYFDDFHGRFTDDLALVSERPPGFVTPTLLAWMAEEVRRLAAAVASTSAFQAPAASLIHGDLWAGNVLVADDGLWHLLDWDDLRIGDAVHDLSKLVDPADDDGACGTRDELADLLRGAEARARLGRYHRAILLDWILDPLADLVASDDEDPDHAEAWRARKEREHHDALALYRERYA